MSYMPQLTYVDMDSCGLQPKRLEEINLNHPNAKVVFRVFFGDNYTARTDAERILASMASRGGMLTDSNVEGLYYCHDVKYLDLGHNTYLTNIGFTAQMPKLEVAILGMCNIRDARLWQTARTLSIWNWPTPTATICARCPDLPTCAI